MREQAYLVLKQEVILLLTEKASVHLLLTFYVSSGKISLKLSEGSPPKNTVYFQMTWVKSCKTKKE